MQNWEAAEELKRIYLRYAGKEAKLLRIYTKVVGKQADKIEDCRRFQAALKVAYTALTGDEMHFDV